jgi:hypothetical protein
MSVNQALDGQSNHRLNPIQPIPDTTVDLVCPKKDAWMRLRHEGEGERFGAGADLLGNAGRNTGETNIGSPAGPADSSKPPDPPPVLLRSARAAPRNSAPGR